MKSHDGYVEEGLTGADYSAGCSCGWEGKPREVHAEAMADLKRHYDTRADDEC
jgi:hypothetical protein